jgi:arsenate reductase
MKRRVLFLCTGNSARSQMAEALLRQMAGDEFDAYSAGTHPVGLNPRAVAAMQERGVDITQQRSKHVAEFDDQKFDYVITVCDRAKETCPILPGAGKVLHWSFEDPAAASPDATAQMFRQVRDAIAKKIREILLKEASISADSL